MQFRAPQTPGIDGLSNQFTAAEAIELAELAGIANTQGSIIYHNGTNWVGLTPGTSGHFLKTQGAAANPTWAAASSSLYATTALDNLASVAINTDLILGTSDAAALGSATKMWSDLFLASGAVINFNAGDVTLTHGANVLTLGGGDLALGANNMTMTGSIAATGARATKGWFTDLESTNMPTVGGTAILTSLTAPQFTTIELGHASDTTLSRTGAGDIAVEGNAMYRAGGTDVPVVDGGTGTSTGAMTLVQGATRTIQIDSNTTGAGDQFTIAAGRALSGGTDLTGGVLVLASGVGTGAGGSYISFQTSKASATGTADNAVFQAVTINGNSLTLHPHGTGAGNTYELRLEELNANGDHYVGFKSADSLAASLIWTLPSADGGANAVLKTDGSGTLAWTSTSTASLLGTIELGHASDTTIARAAAGRATIESVAIARSSSGSSTDNTIARFDSTTGDLIQTTGIVVDDSNNISGMGNIQLGENSSLDLDPAGSADGKYSGICITGTAGTTLAFGDLIYLAVADSRWELADADAAATMGTPLLGMCVLAAAADGNATKILLYGQIRADAKFPALTIGATVYGGETAGAIQVAIPTGADNIIRVVGHALTADEILFNPSQDHQVTVA